MTKDEEEGGRSMEKKKHSDSEALPLELIAEILLRLPVRSVLRFRCVCKSWLSLISDPQFGIAHYDLAAAPSYRLLLRSDDYYVESIDMEAQLNKHSVPLYFPLPPPSPPSCRKYDYYNNRHLKHEIVGSCRGLVLLAYSTCDLILWNPSIGVHKRLPFPVYDSRPEKASQFLHGFGYDASTDDYLLVLVASLLSARVEARTQIFSFKSNSWIIHHTNFSYRVTDKKFRTGSLLNGALHWLVFSQDKRLPTIIAFDLEQRSLSEIPLLDDLTKEKYQIYSLRVMGECLSVCCSVKGFSRAEIWVMKEYKVKSSWTKSVVTSNQFSPIHVTKDGGIFGSNVLGKLEKLNDKGKLLKHLTYGRDDTKLYPVNLQSAMYRESLVSLPRSFGKTSEGSLGKTSEDDHQ